MSKIDLSQKEIIFLANVLNATPFRLGDAAVGIQIFQKLLPFVPKTDGAVKETN